MNHRRAAFTLVELLVVIGIIALLISILLPALGRAKGAANTVKCLSNVRQLAMASTIQATERRGFIQASSEKDILKLLDPTRVKYVWRTSGADPVPADWASALLPYMGDKSRQDLNFKDSTSKRELFQCPSDVNQLAGSNNGYAIMVNVGVEYVPASYALNADIASAVDPRNGKGFFNFSTEITVYRGVGATAGLPLNGRINKIPRASETLLYVDAGVRPRSSGPTEQAAYDFSKLMQHSDILAVSTDDFAAPRLLTGAPAMTDDVQGTLEYVHRTKKLPLDRHGGKLVGGVFKNGKLNVGFVDGHAETVLQGDFKKVRVTPYKY